MQVLKKLVVVVTQAIAIALDGVGGMVVKVKSNHLQGVGNKKIHKYRVVQVVKVVMVVVVVDLIINLAHFLVQMVVTEIILLDVMDLLAE